jgi:hypothetical protein
LIKDSLWFTEEPGDEKWRWVLAGNFTMVLPHLSTDTMKLSISTQTFVSVSFTPDWPLNNSLTSPKTLCLSERDPFEIMNQYELLTQKQFKRPPLFSS